jgi:Ca2+-binding RTX toxin-like protein
MDVTSGGYNVWGDSCTSVGTDDQPPDASFLGPLANNGGLTETHTIAPASLPIDHAGEDPGCDGTTRDQRGVRRPNDGCDSGAYELGRCQGVVINVIGFDGGGDNLAGTHGPDGIIALTGDDSASGGDGNDGLCGGPGNDRLVGGDGRDQLSGGVGKDFLNGGPGRDTCVGGPGRDRFWSCERRSQ